MWYQGTCSVKSTKQENQFPFFFHCFPVKANSTWRRMYLFNYHEYWSTKTSCSCGFRKKVKMFNLKSHVKVTKPLLYTLCRLSTCLCLCTRGSVKRKKIKDAFVLQGEILLPYCLVNYFRSLTSYQTFTLYYATQYRVFDPSIPSQWHYWCFYESWK